MWIAPGNAGTMQFGCNVDIDYNDVDRLLAFALAQRIDLTIVGLQRPLARGIVDKFQAEGLRIFGATKAAARLETSKAFAKAFMQRNGIPTPRYATFNNAIDALEYLDEQPEGGIVVKLSGLGKRGQGVTVCDSLSEARTAVQRYMIDREFGDSGTTIVIEERIVGPEVSLFGICDGRTAVAIGAARDHKRLLDGDAGPNTAGMGAIAPPPGVDAAWIKAQGELFLQRVVDGMAAEGTPYVGMLYAGLMLTEQGIQCLEYNVRLGNPEAQSILPLLQGDLLEAVDAAVERRLDEVGLEIRPKSTATVAVTTPGYPSNYPTGLPIGGIQLAEQVEGVTVYHHGTRCQNGQPVTQMGRAVTITAIARRHGLSNCASL